MPTAYILWRVAREWGFTPSELKEQRNTGGNYHRWNVPPLVVARDLAMLMVSELMPHKTPGEIGMAFERDRKTVISNIAMGRRIIAQSLIIRTNYQELRSCIEAEIGAQGKGDQSVRSLIAQS